MRWPARSSVARARVVSARHARTLAVLARPMRYSRSTAASLASLCGARLPRRPLCTRQPLIYSDAFITDVLADVKTVAIVGASTSWKRPSFFVMKYLQQKGYTVYPVNPRAVGETILGEEVYATLADLPETVDMVDVFRGGDAAAGVTDEAIAHGAKVVWMQLGVVNSEAAARAESSGLHVVMDRCPKIEFSRLFGELSWHGFDSGVISSRKRKAVGVPGGRDRSRAPSAAECGAQEEALPIPGFETRSIHAGAAPDPTTGARSTPIYQTSSFVFDDADHAASLFNLQTFGNIYTRLSNPTTAVLEERLASLEGGRGSTCTASGHAAQMVALLPLMSPGARIVASNRLYGGSITQLGGTFKKFGWLCTFVDADDHDAVTMALREPGVKALFAESLANPGGVVTDIEALARAANDAEVPLMIDNTLATPYLCRPLEHGADIVVHSTTKFLSGHGNAMGGAVVDSGKFNWLADGGTGPGSKFPSLGQPEPGYHGLTFAESFGDLAYTTYSHAVGLRDLGPCMAPMNAYLTLMGTETLALRMERHVQNAKTVAQWLEAHPKVEWVSYAGLRSSPYHKLGRKYMPLGAGSVFTFGVKGGFEHGINVVEGCQLISHLANVGDVRSLILHPASTTHRQLSKDQRNAAGAEDDVVRLSVGLESVDDIIADLDQALRR